MSTTSLSFLHFRSNLINLPHVNFKETILPRELLHAIFLMIGNDVIRCRLVCKAFCAIADQSEHLTIRLITLKSLSYLSANDKTRPKGTLYLVNYLSKGHVHIAYELCHLLYGNDQVSALVEIGAKQQLSLFNSHIKSFNCDKENLYLTLIKRLIEKKDFNKALAYAQQIDTQEAWKQIAVAFAQSLRIEEALQLVTEKIKEPFTDVIITEACIHLFKSDLGAQGMTLLLEHPWKELPFSVLDSAIFYLAKNSELSKIDTLRNEEKFKSAWTKMFKQELGIKLAQSGYIFLAKTFGVIDTHHYEEILIDRNHLSQINLFLTSDQVDGINRAYRESQKIRYPFMYQKALKNIASINPQKPEHEAFIKTLIIPQIKEETIKEEIAALWFSRFSNEEIDLKLSYLKQAGVHSNRTIRCVKEWFLSLLRENKIEKAKEALDKLPSSFLKAVAMATSIHFFSWPKK